MPYQSVAPQHLMDKPSNNVIYPLASKSKIVNGDHLHASVEIHDSSDDDISSDIEFPADIMQPPEIHSAPRDDSDTHATLVNNEVDEDIVFDSELSPDRAIDMIIELQTTVSDLAKQGIQLITQVYTLNIMLLYMFDAMLLLIIVFLNMCNFCRDMEAMLGKYQRVVNQAAQSQTEARAMLVRQWDATKRHAQELLESVRVSMPAE
ncbi:hypothetical protein GGH93_004449 [Coemansia aciculifera]|nr:hypothetical protein GGH93_004449 [Coemansia aciculifera]